VAGCVLESNLPDHGERAGRVDDEEPAVWQPVFLRYRSGGDNDRSTAANGQHSVRGRHRAWPVVEVRALGARCQQPESGGGTAAKSHAARILLLKRLPIQAQSQVSALFPSDQLPRMPTKVPALENNSGSCGTASSIQATCTAAASQRRQA
jgi:hypothetical protein